MKEFHKACVCTGTSSSISTLLNLPNALTGSAGVEGNKGESLPAELAGLALWLAMWLDVDDGSSSSEEIVTVTVGKISKVELLFSPRMVPSLNLNMEISLHVKLNN